MFLLGLAQHWPNVGVLSGILDESEVQIKYVILHNATGLYVILYIYHILLGMHKAVKPSKNLLGPTRRNDPETTLS